LVLWLLAGQGLMRVEAHLTRPRDFDRVYSEGRSWANGPVAMKALPNGLAFSRCGFSVGRRVGKAVIRNRVKRRLRAILREKDIAPGFDIVFMAKASASASSYKAIDSAVVSVLVRANMLRTEPAIDAETPVNGKAA
jgi:ribonuclease P protein component